MREFVRASSLTMVVDIVLSSWGRAGAHSATVFRAWGGVAKKLPAVDDNANERGWGNVRSFVDWRPGDRSCPEARRNAGRGVRGRQGRGRGPRSWAGDREPRRVGEI